jgi:3-phosphoshikimate 1-carboxyvinyltransferase
MAFAAVGLKLAGVLIKNPACVSKTFPDFFAKLASLTAA